jgi:hypothetical protein
MCANIFSIRFNVCGSQKFKFALSIQFVSKHKQHLASYIFTHKN